MRKKRKPTNPALKTVQKTGFKLATGRAKLSHSTQSLLYTGSRTKFDYLPVIVDQNYFNFITKEKSI